MSRLSHTPEPWSPVVDSRGDHVVIGPRSEVVAIVPAYRSAAQHVANLQRIALCVNACAGLSNHQLQQIAAGHCSLTEIAPDGSHAPSEEVPHPPARHAGHSGTETEATSSARHRRIVDTLF